jgi:hypothetical protein
MKSVSPPTSLFVRTSLLCASILGAAASLAYAAPNAYLTIQPNTVGDAVVYTLSWAALDTQFLAGSVYDNPATPLVNEGLRDKINRNTAYGNGTSELDLTSAMAGGQYTFDNTANGGSVTTEVGYRHTGTGGAPIANNATRVFYQNPLNLTLTHTTPALATPKWDDVGDFGIRGDLTYGVGVLGVTGFRTVNPNGTGTQFTSVGIYTDEDVSAGDPQGLGSANAYDDIGPLLSGFADPAGGFSEAPNTGYIQVIVPSPGGNAASEFVAGTGRWNVGTFTSNPSIQVTVNASASYVPILAVSGDFDGDQDVDATDLAVPALVGNFTGAASTTAPLLGKYYRHGDTDSDYDVDNADLGYVVGAFAATPGTPPAATGSATLTYDPANGNVKLNATTAGGAKITSFQLQTSAATIIPANYTAVTGGTYNGTYKNVTTSVIGDTDTSLAGVTGSAIDLGNVFPTGMDLTQLTAYLTTRVYTGESGTRQQQLTLAVASAATLDHFAISAIASLQTVGTAITGITLTAQDATNATFTGFTGTVTFGGTAGITGTSASFVNGALSGVSVTPTVAGSNLTFTVTDHVSGKTGSATIATVQTRYAAWSGGALANVDTNSDGVLNGVAWVVGATNPSASATALQPTSDITTDPDFLTFTYRRTDAAKIDANTTIAVEYGSDLSGWTTAVHDGTNIIITPTDDGAGVGIDLVQVKIKKTLAVGSSLFARLKVVITP